MLSLSHFLIGAWPLAITPNLVHHLDCASVFLVEANRIIYVSGRLIIQEINAFLMSIYSKNNES